MAGKNNIPAKMGRKIKPVEWDKVEALLKMGGTAKECCAVLGVSYEHLSNRCKADHDMTFSEWKRDRNFQFKASIRRMQYMSAREGNITMQIWLGKIYLGQNEKMELIHRGSDVKIEVGTKTQGEQVDRFLKREVKKNDLDAIDTEYEDVTED